MQKTTFIENLRTYLKRSETASVPYKVVGIQEFGTGVIVVKDTLGEYDVYFDTTLWEFVYPQIWDNGGVTGSLVSFSNIGVLPGLGKAPAVDTFDNAFIFAKQQLKPKVRWNDPLPAIRKRL